LRRGFGVAPNDQEAERLYTAAAKQGHSSAQLALGSLKAQSAATDQEWAQIAKWYRMASDAGHPTAMFSLAQLLEAGRGLPADAESALQLYRRAAGAGLSEAAAEVQRVEAELKNTQPVV
jgi:TPR repeat protein